MPRDGMRREEPGRGPWCENEKKKKGRMEEKGSPGLLLFHAVARGTWHLVVDRANEGSVSRGLLLLFYPVK